MTDHESQVVVTPHDGACGATVTGVNLADLDDAAFAAVLRAWHTYGVVAFPGQHLEEADQVAFSRRLGSLERTNLRNRDAIDRQPKTHRGRPWDMTQPRIMRRTTIAGDAPVGDTNEWAM